MTQAAARHWDEWQRRRTPGRFADWADHPYVFQRLCAHAFGDPACDFFDFIQNSLPELANAHVLSLCCGDGAFEQSMLERGVFGRVTGLDVSPERVRVGQERVHALGGELAARMKLHCDDVNHADLGSGRYDVVFAKSALHHIENLEHALPAMVRCLKPDGVLVTIDFFGPTRFQWTEEQLRARSWFWRHRVPAALRLDEQGLPIPEIGRPDLEAMIAMDPSEAVRSGELHALLTRQFEPIHDIELGGALLNLLLYGDIVNRFDPDKEAHRAVIAEAFELERLLMEFGVLDSDFRLIIARPRPSGNSPASVPKESFLRRLARRWGHPP